MSLLGKLVALANRPGTASEGTAARARAERVAAAEGLELVEIRGELVAVDEWKADLYRRLEEIAEGRRPKELDA